MPVTNHPDTRRRVSFPRAHAANPAQYVLALQTARRLARPAFERMPTDQLVRYIRTTSRPGTFAAAMWRHHRLHGQCVICGQSTTNSEGN